MRNKSKRVLAVMMAMLVAASGAAATATTAFAADTVAENTIGADVTVKLVIPSTADIVYTGSAIELDDIAGATLEFYKDGAKVEAAKDTDYTLTYKNNTNVGTATIVVEDVANDNNVFAGGSAEVTFTIKAAPLTKDMFTISDTGITYDGTEKEVTITPKGVADGWEKDKDYTVTYANNVNATATNNTKASYTITSKNPNVTGSVTGYFDIAPASGATIEVSDVPSQTYTGRQIKPAVTLKDGETVLKEGTDYDVTYGENIYTDTQGTIDFTMKGNYAGATVQQVQFDIQGSIQDVVSKIEIADAVGTVYQYDGTEKKPTVKVTEKRGNSGTGNNTITIGNNEYTVKYENNVKAGTGTIIITSDSAAGEMKINFTIEPQALPESAFEDAFKNKAIIKEYDDGAAIRLTAEDIFTTNFENLVEGTDYTVTYANNVKAGKATATVKFIGNLAGTETKTTTFEINQKAISNTTAGIKVAPATGDVISKTYTGAEIVVPSSEVKVTYEKTLADGKTKETVTIPASEYTVKINGSTGATAVGTYDLSIEAAENSNYTFTSVEGANLLKVTRANWNNVTASAGDVADKDNIKDKTGNDLIAAVKDAITVALNGVELTVDADWEVTSAVWNDAKTAIIAIVNSVSGSGLTYDSQAGKEVTVNVKADIDGVIALAPDESKVANGEFAGGVAEYVYDGTAKTPKLLVKAADEKVTLKEGVDYKFVYTKDSKTVAAPTDAGEYKVEVAGMGKYAGTTDLAQNGYDCTFEITAANIADAKDETKELVYNGTALTDKDVKDAVALSFNGKALVQGADKDYTVAMSANSSSTIVAGENEVTVTGVGNFTGTKTVIVKVVEVATPDAPVNVKVKSYTDTTAKLTFAAVEGATGYEIYNGETKVATATTQDGAATITKTVTGLDADTAYNFTVKAVKTTGDVTKVSDASEAVAVTTRLPKVTGLKAIKKTQTTLKLQFNAVEGADAYRIYDAETGKALANVTTQNGAAVLKKTVTGLKAGETRKYKVRAISVQEDGSKVFGVYSSVYTKATAK